MEIDYERKALKYKMKYLELRQKYFVFQQEGGNYLENFTKKKGEQIYTTTNNNILSKTHDTLEKKLQALYYIRLNDEKYTKTEEFKTRDDEISQRETNGQIINRTMNDLHFNYIPIKIIIDILYNEISYDEVKFQTSYKIWKTVRDGLSMSNSGDGLRTNPDYDYDEGILVFDMLKLSSFKDYTNSKVKLVEKITEYNNTKQDNNKKIKILHTEVRGTKRYLITYEQQWSPNKVIIKLPDSDAINFFLGNNKTESARTLLTCDRNTNTENLLTKYPNQSKITLFSRDILDPTLLTDTWNPTEKTLIDDYIKLRIGKLYVKDINGNEIGSDSNSKVKANAEYLLKIRKISTNELRKPVINEIKSKAHEIEKLEEQLQKIETQKIVLLSKIESLKS